MSTQNTDPTPNGEVDVDASAADDALARETGEVRVEGVGGKLITVLLISWSLLQFYMASGLGSNISNVLGFGLVNDIWARALHLFFGSVLCFLIFTGGKDATAVRRVPWFDYLLAGIIGLACIWQAFFYAEIIGGVDGGTRSLDFLGMSFPHEFLLGWAAILVMLEAARRAVGMPLAIIGAVFMFYTLFNSYLPPPFGLSDVSAERYVVTQWYGQEGIFGIPLSVSTKTIFLFVLFGALLDKGGAGKWFIDMAFAAVGHLRGGPAKSAVLASGMTGMISGSSIANTVTTGTFTIPIMKQNGYPAVKAGAVEVASSVNGQIMPPIMGAAAFVMAEVLGIPYFDVVKHAFIPAIISYIALFYIVHIEALKLGLKPAIRPDAPLIVLKRGWHYLIPIGVLIYVLTVLQYTPERAAYYCILTLVVVFFIEYAMEFWKEHGAGALKLAFFKTVNVIIQGLIAGGRNMVGVAIAVAAAGLVMGSIGASGLSNALQEILTSIAGDAIVPILIATAVLSIILGMGLPTTANYLIVSTLMVGIVSSLGRQAGFDFPLIAIHLFCFYFGLMADVTPPVGLASFAAASISRADPIKTGFQAFWYSARTAILPFVFLFNAELLLIGVESFAEGALVFFMSLIAIIAFTALTQGWMRIKLNIAEALLLVIVTIIMFRPGIGLNLMYPEQLNQIDQSALVEGVEAEELTFNTINMLDEEGVIVVSSSELEGGVISWDSLGLGASESFMHEGATQVTLANFSGPGAEAGFANGMAILSIEQAEPRPSKYWFYIPGVVIFVLVILWQTMRLRRQEEGSSAA